MKRRYNFSELEDTAFLKCKECVECDPNPTPDGVFRLKNRCAKFRRYVSELDDFFNFGENKDKYFLNIDSLVLTCFVKVDVSKPDLKL